MPAPPVQQPYPRRLVGNARRLRKTLTDAERMLWRRLRGKQVLGVRFYRQRPLLGYVVDFYCPAATLVVEVDGGQHFEIAGKAADQSRDQRLREAGLKVLRFSNREVMREPSGVLETIVRVVERRLD